MTVTKTTEDNDPPVSATRPRPVSTIQTPRTEPVVLPEIWGRIASNLIYQPFLTKCQQLMTACAARGARYYAISGLRSWDEQSALYAQGRTAPGKIVTNARPGESCHNFAIAIDFCRDADTGRAGLQPDWNLESYRILAEEAVKLGLESAFNWKSFKEGPHVQLPLSRHDISLAQLREIYHKTGQAGVEHLLNKFSW